MLLVFLLRLVHVSCEAAATDSLGAAAPDRTVQGLLVLTATLQLQEDSNLVSYRESLDQNQN